MGYLNRLNYDDGLRQRIMGIKTDYTMGGVEKYEGMTLETLNRLVANGFVDLELTQNFAPTVGRFKELLEKYPNEPVSLHGYVVSPERRDYRIEVEGVSGESSNPNFINDFTRLCRHADDFILEEGSQYCWFS